jgi:hypothetical protein
VEALLVDALLVKALLVDALLVKALLVDALLVEAFLEVGTESVMGVFAVGVPRSYGPDPGPSKR